MLQSRRHFLGATAAAAAVAGCAALRTEANGREEFKLRYVLASSMYGRMPIDDVLAEVRKTGTELIDIWPEQHSNHREQIEELGYERFGRMLAQHGVKVEIYTCYRPGLLQSEKWMATVRKLGGSMIIAGAEGPKNLAGAELRSAIKKFAEKALPVLDRAAELGVKIGLENHAGGLLSTPEALPLMMDALPDIRVGIALAPYHLPQDPKRLAELIATLGSRIFHFYAWEHGAGSSKPLPTVLQMKQMPGYGMLDFRPLLAALKQINYLGGTSIFMHPVPRGMPILPTAAEVTTAINRSREYLEHCLTS